MNFDFPKADLVETNLPEAPPRRRASGAALMQPAVTNALTRALFEEWARVGYGALSLEAVARRAGVGKAALYRRWPSKLAMVSDRLEQVGVDLAEVPDTGSLAGDVRALLKSVRRLLRHPLVRRILPDLHAEMSRSPELARAIRERTQVARRARAATIFRRAIARGEVSPDLDVELANDALAGLIYWRMIVIGRRVESAYLEKLACFILAAFRSFDDGENGLPDVNLPEVGNR
jgi:AcrR family transcriptional regulator